MVQQPAEARSLNGVEAPQLSRDAVHEPFMFVLKTKILQDFDRRCLKVALCFSGVNFVSLNFTDYVSMALCMGDNRVGDTSDLLDLPQEMGLARRGSF